MLLKEELLTVALQNQRENIHSLDGLTAYLLDEKLLREDLSKLLEREENLKLELHSMGNKYSSPGERTLIDSSTCMTEYESQTDERASSSNCSLREDLDESYGEGVNSDSHRSKRMRRDSKDSSTRSAESSPSTLGETLASSINVYETFKNTPRQSGQLGRASRSREKKAPVHPYDALDDKELNVDGSALNVESLRFLEDLGWRRKKCPKLIPLQKSSSTVYLPPGQSENLSQEAVRNREYFLTIAAARYFEDGAKFTNER